MRDRRSANPSRRLRRFIAGLIVALGFPFTAVSASTPITVEIVPSVVTNGHVVLFRIDTTRMACPVVGIQGRIDDKRIPVYRHPRGDAGIYFGIAGMPYQIEAGKKNLVLEWTDHRGYHRIESDFSTEIGDFRSETLRVAPRKANPNEKDLQRISGEQEAVRRVYALGHPVPLWDGPFQKPLNTPITSPYGSRRVFNGKMKSYHSGVDFRAAVGTPIRAANTGIVRMARDLFFSGNHVILDHGGGVFTNYSHLDKFLVQPGEHVNKGRPIGLAGATGRVNGPHLHWGAKVHAIKVNPLDLIEALNGLYSSGTVDRTFGSAAESPRGSQPHAQGTRTVDPVVFRFSRSR